MGTFAIVVFSFAILMVFMSVKAVPQGEEYTVEHFDRPLKSLRNAHGISWAIGAELLFVFKA